MVNLDIYNKVTINCSKVTTQLYSTSFSWAIKLINKQYRDAIYCIYGFVRFADEIVDTFYNTDQRLLFEQFKKDTFDAIINKISINPILHSFQQTVNHYNIELKLIESFFYSMQMDLFKSNYNKDEYDNYIYGSAEVVGLMCLQVFYSKDSETFDFLKPYAQKLGQAFQKINFLRDIRHDYNIRKRIYFPEINIENFSVIEKQQIESDIDNDFKFAYTGMLKLKKEVKLAVYLAYLYFRCLLKNLKNLSPSIILNKRVRVNNFRKILLLIKAWFLVTFKII